VVLRLRTLARRPLEQHLELGLEGRDLLEQSAAVAVAAVGVPGGEETCCEREAGFAEPLLRGEALAVGGEVPEQMCPAELALLGVEVVVGPPAIRAGDAGEILAEQRRDLTLVTAGGDPEQALPARSKRPRACAARPPSASRSRRC
jgi:hypothetical protein